MYCNILPPGLYNYEYPKHLENSILDIIDEEYEIKNYEIYKNQILNLLDDENLDKNISNIISNNLKNKKINKPINFSIKKVELPSKIIEKNNKKLNNHESKKWSRNLKLDNIENINIETKKRLVDSPKIKNNNKYYKKSPNNLRKKFIDLI